LEQQISYGNDRKKSKGNSKGKGNSKDKGNSRSFDSSAAANSLRACDFFVFSQKWALKTNDLCIKKSHKLKKVTNSQHDSLAVARTSLKTTGAGGGGAKFFWSVLGRSPIEADSLRE